MVGRYASSAAFGPSRSATLAVLQIGLVALLIYACVRIVLPFAGLLLWSIVLAILLYPLHLRLMARLGNRWSAVLIGVVGAAVVLVPTVLVAASLASSLASLLTGLQNNTLSLPPPPPKLASLPLIGERVTEAWAAVAGGAPEALRKYGPMLRKPIGGLASFAGRLTAAELSFVLSFAIAATLVAYGRSTAEFAGRLLHLVTGSRAQGARLADLTVATIRGVALGVVGVAVIQAALLAAGFFAIGLSGAGLLTLVVLLLGIVQVPATLLSIPVIAYVFATEATGPATIFAVWTLVAGLSDNVLKPLMLGRGLEVPMPVILLGVIGGMIADGLLGLFLGPVLLAIAYVLFRDWLRQQQEPVQPAATPAPADGAAT
jgi:predicted PurR-regulated permease PerM